MFTDDELKKVALVLTRQLIDIGAKCQKKRSFNVTLPNSTKLQSVYTLCAEDVEKFLKEVRDHENI